MLLGIMKLMHKNNENEIQRKLIEENNYYPEKHIILKSRFIINYYLNLF